MPFLLAEILDFQGSAHLIGVGSLSTIIINISRGPIIDDQALAEALASRRIQGAGVDVFEEEPLSLDSPLHKLDNIIMTPHSAYYGKESIDLVNYLIGKITVDFFEKKVIYKRQLANTEILKTPIPYDVSDEILSLE